MRAEPKSAKRPGSECITLFLFCPILTHIPPERRTMLCYWVSLCHFSPSLQTVLCWPRTSHIQPFKALHRILWPDFLRSLSLFRSKAILLADGMLC